MWIRGEWQRCKEISICRLRVVSILRHLEARVRNPSKETDAGCSIMVQEDHQVVVMTLIGVVEEVKDLVEVDMVVVITIGMSRVDTEIIATAIVHQTLRSLRCRLRKVMQKIWKKTNVFVTASTNFPMASNRTSFRWLPAFLLKLHPLDEVDPCL